MYRRIVDGEVVILDGGCGTELQALGFVPTLPLWSARALFEAPDLVAKVHQRYLAAGAEILIANSYRTSRRAFRKAGRENEWRMMAIRAVEIARHERDGHFGAEGVCVAGSLGALEGNYDPSLAPSYEIALREHGEVAQALAEAGADLLICETMNKIDEARGAAEAACRTGLPTWVGFAVREDGRLHSGESVEEAVAALSPLDVQAFLVNCSSPGASNLALRKLAGCSPVPVGVYANLGRYEAPTWQFDPEVSPERYLLAATGWVELGGRIVGGCCGTRPAHIRALAERLSRRSVGDASGR
jgi:S-methylmethionine-dependent homocysteine/selenocysteine methylase